MEWSDEGLLLGVKRHGERSFVAEVLTQNYGRYLGLIQSVNQSERPLLQSGNRVWVHWHARLAQHLGRFKLDVTENRAPKFCENRLALGLMHTVISHTRLLPERDPHPEMLALCETCLDSAEHKDQHQALLALLAFEYDALGVLGFGLDFYACALTGARESLCWLSPTSGRAVSHEAGLPWSGRLLKLPKRFRRWVLARDHGEVPIQLEIPTLLESLEITGFFLKKRLYEEHRFSWPIARHWLIGV